MSPQASEIAPWRFVIGTVLSCFLLTTLLISMSVFFSWKYVLPPGGRTLAPRGGSERLMLRSDALWYEGIVKDGYSYDPSMRSSVAFFPTYPLLAKGVSNTTGLTAAESLLAVSNTAHGVSLLLLMWYSRRRFPHAPSSFPVYTLLSFCLFPIAFFHHMPYSESFFIALVVAATIGVFTQWPRFFVAAIIGLATATRPVGVALILPFLLQLWYTRRSIREFFGQTALHFPICCWGILAYMIYLWVEFGQPLAFAQTQEYWRIVPPAPLKDRLLSLFALEPLWGYWDPDSPFYWSRGSHNEPSIFSAPIMDRMMFLAVVALTVTGWYKRWLTPEELVLTAGLVGIAYFLRADEMAFSSQGRFVSVAFPIYLVSGRLLAAAPQVLSIGILCMSSFFLAVYTALFAAGHTFI